MPYTYLEHTADMGIRAEGDTLEQAFESAAEGMLALMYDPKTVGSDKEVPLGASAPDLAEMFIEVLNELLFIQDKNLLALKGLKDCEITEIDGLYTFTGTATGTEFTDQIAIRTEVKAATYSGLSYEFKRGTHRFECVLDL